MRIAVCDDCSIDRAIITDMLQQYMHKRSLPCTITEYEQGHPLMDDVLEGAVYTIVFLDIVMQGILGIDVARELRKHRFEGSIVFCTSCSTFAVDGYDVAASGYLLKPISFPKLAKVLDRLVYTLQENCYTVRQRQQVIPVPYHDILFVESQNNRCMLHRSNGDCYTIYTRLSDIEHDLNDARFLRCHQSFLVNMQHIVHVGDSFLLSTGDVVSIRQRDLRIIRQTYIDYIKSQQLYQ